MQRPRENSIVCHKSQDTGTMPSSTAPSSPWGRSGGGAEPPNPFLTTYDNFCQRTPLITRYVLTTLSVTYVLSFIFDPTYALSCIPYATVFKFQLYRLITSSLLCTNALSLLFAFLSFGDTGRRMEHGLGSAAMGTLICTLSLLINASYVVLSLLTYVFTRSSAAIAMPNNSGFWSVLLAIIAIECSTAPAESNRRLIGAYEIRTRYYPLLLLGLFTLFGGFHLAYGLGVAFGYAYGLGKLDMIKPAQERLIQWENGVLVNFTSRQGWVAGHAASGSNAWALPSSNTGGGEGGSGGGWSPATFFQGRQQGSEGSSGPGQIGSPNPPVEPAGFPTTGGRALGDGIGSSTGAKQRPTASAVAEAAERRAKTSAAAAARSADISDDV